MLQIIVIIIKIYIYTSFVEVKIRNANHTRVTVPIFDYEQLFLKQSKFYLVENSTPLVGLELHDKYILLYTYTCAIRSVSIFLKRQKYNSECTKHLY